jgi:hypothetical protein
LPKTKGSQASDKQIHSDFDPEHKPGDKAGK